MKRLDLGDDVGAAVAGVRPAAARLEVVRAAVAAIVADVRAHGDGAVRAHTQRLDGVELRPEYALTGVEMDDALGRLPRELRQALTLAADNIRAYHEREMPEAWRETLAQGQIVGQETVPLGVAGLYVPGGLADYPSTVLMTAVPAQVAGVGRIVVCSPGRAGGGVATGVAAACAFLGITELFPVGGAQAVAAMAYGTAAIPRCDVIAGPGNAYVTEAKRQVMGDVRIDGLAGPSEVIIVCDHTGRPDWLAADLLAQAEHGAGSSAVLIDVGGALGDVVERETARLAAEFGIATENVALVSCRDRAQAIAFVNEYAPEHLELHLSDARTLVGQVRNAGAVFVGPHSATAFADYAAGTNHVLPTGGSARFGQGLSVVDFQKRVGVVELDRAAARALAGPVAAIATEEGLRAHARSAELRAE